MSIIHDILPADAAERLRPKKPLEFLPWTGVANFQVDGRRFDPSLVPYLIEIYYDTSRDLTVKKASQIGMTVYSLGRVLHGADQLGERWIYFLPTDEEMDLFVADRVDATIRESDHLTSRMGKTDNRALKQIGPGLVYLRGLWSKRRAKSVPADGLVFDELDEHRPGNVAMAKDRILASSVQRTISLSVPSFSNYGIDRQFKETDQRHFQHKCSSCGKWNCLDKDFPLNFLPVPANERKSFPDGATHYRGCRWCGAKLDMSAGVWVPDFPERSSHGYLVSRLYTLICPPDSPNVATYLMGEYEKSHSSTEDTERWEISFRARPFDGEGARINDDLLLSLERDTGFLYRGNGNVMGVDCGNSLHVSIYHKTGMNFSLIYAERTKSWERVHALFRQFGCYIGGVDRGPELHTARAFAHKFKGKVYLISFGSDEIDSKDDHHIKRKVRDDLHEGKHKVPWVTVDRTASLDATVDFVCVGRLMLPSRKRLHGDDRRGYDEYRFNLENLKSKQEERASGKKEKIYIRAENHHGMGLNYARIAAFELGIKGPAPALDIAFAPIGGNA